AREGGDEVKRTPPSLRPGAVDQAEEGAVDRGVRELSCGRVRVGAPGRVAHGARGSDREGDQRDRGGEWNRESFPWHSSTLSIWCVSRHRGSLWTPTAVSGKAVPCRA